MLATVDALLPLSLLEAVRDVDRPIDDPETEFVDELRNKRFGLSDTVHAQIRRYAEAVRRSQRAASDEAVALARLIGRRPDAEVVFREAGRRVAERAYATVGAARRAAIRALPGLLARPLALGVARRLARRYFGGTVERTGASVVLAVPQSLTVEAAAPGRGCAFYAAGFARLLQLLVGQEDAVDHVRCAARGEGRCEWRAAWRR